VARVSGSQRTESRNKTARVTTTPDMNIWTSRCRCSLRSRVQVVAALRTCHQIRMRPDQVAGVNALQLRAAIDYVYLRPGSSLMDTVRSFADQRKNIPGRAA
jgi:hypothetical protein